MAGYPSAGCQPEYGPLDVIGVNEYFGWYPGPNGSLFDRKGMSPWLDQCARAIPNKAIMVSEFGAEANRDGPVEEKGTWAYQREFVNFNLATFATKPWLSGALYWALNEFRVRPGWDGGNPRPNPPIHQKGLTVVRDVGAQAGLVGRPEVVPRDRPARARAGGRAGAAAAAPLASARRAD